MEYDEIWAISIPQIENFFKQNPCIRYDGSKYWYKNCAIKIEKLAEKGILQIPQTRVVMLGQDNDTNEIHEKFFLIFLSAGV